MSTLLELLNQEGDNKKVIESIILSKSITFENKKKIIQHLFDGTIIDIMPEGEGKKVTTVQRSIPYTEMMEIMRSIGSELESEITNYMSMVYNLYPGYHNEIKEKFRTILVGSVDLDYSVTGGYDSLDNIGKFKQKLNVIKILNDGHSEEILSEIQKEIIYAVDMKVLSGGQVVKLLEAELPEYSSLAIQYLRQNYASTDTGTPVNMENDMIGLAMTSGVQVEKGSNNASGSTIDSDKQYNPSGIESNTYSADVATNITGRGGFGDTYNSNVTNVISSGGVTITDQKTSLEFQFQDLINIHEMYRRIEMTREQLHEELHAVTSDASKVKKDNIERLHSSLETEACDVGMENKNIEEDGTVVKDPEDALNVNPTELKAQEINKQPTKDNNVTLAENDGKVTVEITEEMLTDIGELLAPIVEYLKKSPQEAFEILYECKSLDNCDPNVREVLKGEKLAEKYGRVRTKLKELAENYPNASEMFADLRSKYAIDTYIHAAQAEIDNQMVKEFKPVGDV